MKAYQLDNEGFFIEEVECMESPLEPGIYLIPGGCITVAPPSFGSNEIPQYINEVWKIVPDFSGILYFSKKDFHITKTFLKGESLNSELYTTVTPLKDEMFQKWNEEKGTWEVDLEKKMRPEIYYLKSDFLSSIELTFAQEPDLVLYTTVTPLKDEMFQKWNEEKGTWEVDLEKKMRPEIYHLKSDFRKIRNFTFAQEPDLVLYTTVTPLKGEMFQKWNEEKGTWEVDEKLKEITELKTKLLNSDYKMTQDYYETMSPNDQEKWKRNRAEWRNSIRELQKEI